jgi:hypothetical protein
MRRRLYELEQGRGPAALTRTGSDGTNDTKAAHGQQARAGVFGGSAPHARALPELPGGGAAFSCGGEQGECDCTQRPAA